MTRRATRRIYQVALHLSSGLLLRPLRRFPGFVDVLDVLQHPWVDAAAGSRILLVAIAQGFLYTWIAPGELLDKFPPPPGVTLHLLIRRIGAFIHLDSHVLDKLRPFLLNLANVLLTIDAALLFDLFHLLWRELCFHLRNLLYYLY